MFNTRTLKECTVYKYAPMILGEFTATGRRGFSIVQEGSVDGVGSAPRGSSESGVGRGSGRRGRRRLGDKTKLP